MSVETEMKHRKLRMLEVASELLRNGVKFKLKMYPNCEYTRLEVGEGFWFVVYADWDTWKDDMKGIEKEFLSK